MKIIVIAVIILAILAALLISNAMSEKEIRKSIPMFCLTEKDGSIIRYGHVWYDNSSDAWYAKCKYCKKYSIDEDDVLIGYRYID